MRWIITLSLLLFSGCSSPAVLKKNDASIGIEYGKQHIEFRAKSIKHDTIAMNGLSVNRTLYAFDADRFVVFESAMAEQPYTFNYDVVRSLDLIFAAKKVIQLDRVGNLGFYVITLRDGSNLLSIAENLNKRGIEMIYGLSKAQMDAAIQSVGGQSKIPLDSLERVVMLSGTDSAFKSRWQPRLIILDMLLQRVVGKPAGIR